MIEFKKGDLFTSDADLLVNTVNTVGVMGKGIALAFKSAFPYNFTVYRRACENDSLAIGQLLIVQDQNLQLGPKTIINLPTKTHWRLPAKYSYVQSGLKALHRYLTDHPNRSVAMPAPGCGNGGLQWKKVKLMIQEQLKDLSNAITVYEP